MSLEYAALAVAAARARSRADARMLGVVNCQLEQMTSWKSCLGVDRKAQLAPGPDPGAEWAVPDLKSYSSGPSSRQRVPSHHRAIVQCPLLQTNRRHKLRQLQHQSLGSRCGGSRPLQGASTPSRGYEEVSLPAASGPGSAGLLHPSQ